MLNKKITYDHNDQKLTFGHRLPSSGPIKQKTIISKGYNTNKLFDTDKCVIHLVDLTQIHIANFISLNSNSYNNSDCSDSDVTDDISVGDINSFCIFNENSTHPDNAQVEVLLQKQLKLITDYITDQYCELWNIMKRGDLLEDVSITQFNDHLDCMDNFSPTRGRYIIDKVCSDLSYNTQSKGNNRLKGSDITRNGLTIKYLVRNVSPKTIMCYTIPMDMYTITDFPIGYFDNIVINDALCLTMGSLRLIGTTHISWGSGNCLVSLDINKLHLNKLTKNKVKHVIKNRENIIIDYLYVIITFHSIRYMIISEYSSALMRYDMKIELKHFMNKLKTVQHMDTYNRKDDILMKDIANSENILMNNVLCI